MKPLGILQRTLVFGCLLAVLPFNSCGGSSPDPGHIDPPEQPVTTTLKAAAAPHGITVSTAADPSFLSEAPYAQILGSDFNALEPENAMKFGPVHPRPNTDPQPFDFAAADQLVTFADQHGMRVRGHTLVWHRQNPSWLTDGNFSAPQLSQILQDHITNVVFHFGSKVYAWDVVNEAFEDNGTMRSTLWYDQPGIGFAGQGTKYVEQALVWARTANANAKLVYNDYNDETVNAKSDAIYAMAQDFKQRGVPLDGIGLQMHVDLSFDTPANIQSLSSNMRRFADLGLEIHITELDVRLPDNSTATRQAQAALYGHVATACRQQPACKLFQTWGFTDKHSWIPGTFPGTGWALPWDEVYIKKPAHDAIVQSWK